MAAILDLVSLDYLTNASGWTGPIFLWLIGGDWRKVCYDDQRRRSFYVVYTYMWSIFASIHPFGLPEDNFA
jgi:hypothetical protein